MNVILKIFLAFILAFSALNAFQAKVSGKLFLAYYDDTKNEIIKENQENFVLITDKGKFLCMKTESKPVCMNVDLKKNFFLITDIKNGFPVSNYLTFMEIIYE